METKNDQSDIIKYPTGRFTLLGLMGLLAALGIILTLILHYFFG